MRVIVGGSVSTSAEASADKPANESEVAGAVPDSTSDVESGTAVSPVASPVAGGVGSDPPTASASVILDALLVPPLGVGAVPPPLHVPGADFIAPSAIERQYGSPVTVSYKVTPVGFPSEPTSSDSLKVPRSACTSFT